MLKIVILALLAICVSIHAKPSTFSGDALISQLKRELNDLRQHTVFSESLNDTLNQLRIPQFFRGYEKESLDKLKASTTCSLCYALVDFLIFERRAGATEDIIALEAELFCTLLGIESAQVCTGVIELNLPIFAYIIDSNENIRGERICDIILQNSGCNETTFEWIVDIPEGSTVERKSISQPESTFNILHISDFHYDPNYTEGKNKDCSEPLCCQSDQADGDVSEGTACGYWSEYHTADSSEALVNESIRYAKEFDFDYVYFTGDIISHRVWSTSVENNTRDMKVVFRKMKKAFSNIPIYPVLGNHEPSPLNEYSIGDDVDASLHTSWLYRLLTSEFSQWLPKSAKREIMKGGFYSVSPREGFRIIALNSNVAYTMNWWLIHNDTDPLGQLAWLTQTLKAAEDNKEVVHILGHIPGGKSDLLQIWSREYNKIIRRFSNTIGAQFNGHTHKDQFMVYFSSQNTTQAISVALNGASIISDKSNPSFKIINVDTKSFDVIDTHEYYFNLTEANLARNATPSWKKLYSFRESYGQSSLTPAAFTELLPRMAVNHSLLDDYHRYGYRNSDVSSGCDNNCKRSALCEIATSEVGDSTQCDWLVDLFNKNV